MIKRPSTTHELSPLETYFHGIEEFPYPIKELRCCPIRFPYRNPVCSLSFIRTWCNK